MLMEPSGRITPISVKNENAEGSEILSFVVPIFHTNFFLPKKMYDIAEAYPIR